MKSETQIQATIDKLHASKDKVSEFSFFGDANWEKIDAQIEALEWTLDLIDIDLVDEE